MAETRAYTPEELKRLWAVELDIYSAFAEACEKLGLRYFAGYGSCLGAMRHKGFIPWDDDMDVCMPRADYEVFLKQAAGALPEAYELLHIEGTPGYVLPYAKLCDRRTVFMEAADAGRRYRCGIFIDVFPLDAAPAGAEARKKQRCRCWLLGREIALAEYGRVKLPAGMNGAAALAVRAACRVLHGGMRLLGKDRLHYYRKLMKAARKYEKPGQDPAVYTTFMDMSVPAEYVPYADVFPTREAAFADRTVRIPARPDAYLTELFGDWRQVPPPEKRHNHPPAVLRFAEEKEEVRSDA